MFQKVGYLSQGMMAVAAGDLGHSGTLGRCGYGSRNANGARILEFADRLNLVICNTQEAKLVSHAFAL